MYSPRLHTAAMEFGSQRSSNLLKTKAVEQCFCPPGYEGLSCESCSYGYTRDVFSLVRITLSKGVLKYNFSPSGSATSCSAASAGSVTATGTRQPAIRSPSSVG